MAEGERVDGYTPGKKRHGSMLAQPDTFIAHKNMK